MMATIWLSPEENTILSIGILYVFDLGLLLQMRMGTGITAFSILH
jgi:hypothetical protein